jgi:DNA-binding MarR family transcriptional regulator
MAGRLQQELKQTKAIASLEEESLLNIVRTADALMLSVTASLKPNQLSPTQYNVLRILRGAGEAGVSCKDIAARLVARDPDITRLMDRLEQRGLIVRDRAREDRRIVIHRLTKPGNELVNELDRPIAALNKAIMSGIKADKLRQLVDVLEQVRANLEHSHLQKEPTI